MRKRLNELVAGETVVNGSPPGSIRTTYPGGPGRCPCPCVFVARSGCLATFTYEGLQFNAMVEDDFWFEVAGPDHAANEYPHRCPRCGARAYVGLLEVDHADASAAARCPARRK